MKRVVLLILGILLPLTIVTTTQAATAENAKQAPKVMAAGKYKGKQGAKSCEEKLSYYKKKKAYYGKQYGVYQKKCNTLIKKKASKSKISACRVKMNLYKKKTDSYTKYYDKYNSKCGKTEKS